MKLVSIIGALSGGVGVTLVGVNADENWHYSDTNKNNNNANGSGWGEVNNEMNHDPYGQQEEQELQLDEPSNNNVDDFSGGMDGMEMSGWSSGSMNGNNNMNGMSNNYNEEAGGAMDEMMGAMLMDGMALLGQCNLDVNQLTSMMNDLGGDDSFGGGGDDIFGGSTSSSLVGSPSSSAFDPDSFQQAVRQGMDLVKAMAVECTPSNQVRFEAAMDDFRTCAGFDLEELIETLFDALVGTEMECILAFVNSGVDLMKWSELDKFPAIPPKCASALFGGNPLGDALRNTLLYPDRVLPCFSDLSNNVPECTLEEWPTPVVGSALKVISCLLGGSGPFLDTLYGLEIKTLSRCLPAREITADVCPDVMDECAAVDSFFLTIPEPFLGVPLPDGFKRLAGEDLASRYDAFTSRCVETVWDGWTNPVQTTLYKAKDNAAQQKEEVEEEEEFGSGSSDSSDEEEKSSESPLGGEEDEETVASAEKLVQDKDGAAPSANKNPFVPFAGGFVCGFVLLGLGLLYSRRRNGNQVETKDYATVENDLELT